MKITAKLSEATAKKLGVAVVPVTVEYNLPATLADKVKAFGEEIVNNASEDSFIITIQALVRRMLQPKVDKTGKVTKAPSTAAEIQTAVTAFKPDVRTMVRQSAFEKATSSIVNLSPEERKALLAQLQALGAAQGAVHSGAHTTAQPAKKVA